MCSGAERFQSSNRIRFCTAKRFQTSASMNIVPYRTMYLPARVLELSTVNSTRSDSEQRYGVRVLYQCPFLWPTIESSNRYPYGTRTNSISRLLATIERC
eukprot:scaffold382074_cov40-Prasinocladus_malaysianus.AAC.1